MKKRSIAGCTGIVIVGIVVVLLLIQLIPYGHNHTNPPVVREPNWDSQQTRILAKRACFDCHSNETTWLWYSNIAPFSWLVQRDVDEGRSKLNFSDWQARSSGEGERESDGEIAEIVLEGEMPPATYFITHPQAKLSTAETQQLAQGLQATEARSPR